VVMQYLTEAVRRRPYSVILLDEIEKGPSWHLQYLKQVLYRGKVNR
jgi:ATP-dependent Clp protease ATP-binding subunit ClpA